jgi:dihydrodipicolinate synthase/N-acetylneuraminate lyase
MQGIFPAVLTPFGSRYTVDMIRFANHVDWLYQNGVHGLFVGGNAGEWYSLSVEEREELTTAAVALSAGRGKTIIHVGCVRMEDTLRLARHAANAGADAIGSLIPCIARLGLREIRNYFGVIAGATDLPFLIYYFPSLTGGPTGETLFTGLRDVPHLTGYKFTDPSLLDMQTLLDDGLLVLNGHDPNLQAALSMGAGGGIGSYYNILPRQAVEIYRACCAGDLKRASDMQRQINRAIRTVRKYRLIPALKCLADLRDPGMGRTRQPVLPLSLEEQQKLMKEMEWMWQAN